MPLAVTSNTARANPVSTQQTDALQQVWPQFDPVSRPIKVVGEPVIDFAHEIYRRKEPQPLKEYWPSLPTGEPAENDTQDAIRAWEHRRMLDTEQRGL